MYRQTYRAIRVLNVPSRKFYQGRFTEIKEEVKQALDKGKPVVALESTIITHGMPYPKNVECALEVEDIVREQGAIPATIAIINGEIKVGLTRKEIELLGDTHASKPKPIKTSRRDFPFVLSTKSSGGTTVSGTLIVAKNVGIRIFATGGIGGVHRGAGETFDISADLIELGKSNVAVVSSGVKSILDIPKTLEYLETQGVFVATIGSTADFPAFYSSKSGCEAPYRVEDAQRAAGIIKSHKDFRLDSGLLFGVPVPEEYSIPPEVINDVINKALEKAHCDNKVVGKNVTPYLLEQVAQITQGKSLQTNIALIKNNARMAAKIAVALSELEEIETKENQKKNDPNQGHPVIIGGSNLDCCATLDTTEIKLDGRIHFGKFSYNPGGVARNICEALYKLGCRPNFISVVGDDIQGKVLMAQIPEEIGKQLQVVKGQSTAQCVVVLDKKGDCSFLMGDMSIHESITPELIRTKEDIIKFSPLMILDANISLKSIEESLKLAEKYKIPVFFEPTDITVAKRPFETPFWKSIKFITPNLSELKQIASFLKISLSNTPTSKIEEAAGIARELAQYIDNIIVTLGPEGVVIARKGLSTEPLLSNSKQNNVYVRHYPAKIITKFTNVSGAGDCLASGFIAALLSGLPEEKCVGVGFAAASCALHSQPPVPHKLFDKSHESWNKITTIYKNL